MVSRSRQAVALGAPKKLVLPTLCSTASQIGAAGSVRVFFCRYRNDEDHTNMLHHLDARNLPDAVSPIQLGVLGLGVAFSVCGASTAYASMGCGEIMTLSKTTMIRDHRRCNPFVRRASASETIACLEARDAPQPIWPLRVSGGLLPAFPPKRDTEEEDEGQSAQVRTRELKLAQPVVAEPQQQPETKPTEHVWLRVGGGYVGGFYSYKEISEQSLGPIYNDPIILGFGEAPAAGTFGFQINAKAWLPQLPQVGFEGNVRRNDWGVVIPYGDLAQGEFSSSRWGSNRREENEVRDGMYVFTARLHGRLFTDVDSTRWSLGGHIGAHVSDFLYFNEVSGGLIRKTLRIGHLRRPDCDTRYSLGIQHNVRIDGVEFGADWFETACWRSAFPTTRPSFPTD